MNISSSCSILKTIVSVLEDATGYDKTTASQHVDLHLGDIKHKTQPMTYHD